MTLSEDCVSKYPTSEEERIQMLVDIQQEIGALVDAASIMIDGSGCRSATRRAQSYWIQHIRTTLWKDHPFPGGPICTMEDTIKEIIECYRKRTEKKHNGRNK